MKILFVTYGSEKAPATRYRVAQYLRHLEERGVKSRVISAISGFSTFLMIRSPDFKFVTKLLYYLYVFTERVVRSFYIIAVSRKFDIVFLQRVTFPFKLEKLLRVANKNIIFDIDDAIYLPDKEGRGAVTRLKKFIKQSEVVSILKISRTVIVENDYIKNFVTRYCRNVHKIPGPIDTERFSVRTKAPENNVVIGWIGSPATTSYLHMLDRVFENIKKKYDGVKFVFIGLGKYENPGIDFERKNWSYETEVGDLQAVDIGVMPMLDNEWTRGKLGCKMLQYMAVGVPAVLSYTPTNAELIQNRTNGFFATGDEEWTKVLSELIEDGSLRREVGKRGRETVVEKCSLAKNIDNYMSIWEEMLKI